MESVQVNNKKAYLSEYLKGLRPSKIDQKILSIINNDDYIIDWLNQKEENEMYICLSLKFRNKHVVIQGEHYNSNMIVFNKIKNKLNTELGDYIDISDQPSELPDILMLDYYT